MMGAQALAVYDVEFDQRDGADKGNRLGGLKGIRINQLLTVSRIALAALAVGQARAAYEYALNYAKERVAFGEPIAHRQSIAFMLANMRIEIEAARLMVWEAAYKYDTGEDASKAALLAKQYADKMVLEVTDSARAGAGRPRLRPRTSGGTVAAQRPRLRDAGMVVGDWR